MARWSTRCGRRAATLLAAAAVTASLATTASPAQADPPGVAQDRVVSAYFASWTMYSRDFFVKDIPAENLTHVQYAFGMPTKDGGCAPTDPWADYDKPFAAEQTVTGEADTWSQPLRGHYNQLLQLKREHPDLKVLISLGGWTKSTYFSDVAATAAAREKFAKACVDAFVDGNLPGLAPGAAKGVFDGIDVDWEYPVAGGDEWGNPPIIHRPEDRENATLLFAELRRQLDAAGARDRRHYELTAALPAGDTTPTRSFEIAKIFRLLDWAGIMTYDFHGSWEQRTGFNSPVRLDPADPTDNAAANTVGSIEHYLANGAPASKLVVGVPFYGKQWANVGPTDHGLYQPGNTQGLVAEDLTLAGTHPTYHALVDVDRVVTDTDGHGNNQKGLQGFTRY